MPENLVHVKKKVLVIAYKTLNSDPRIVREINSLLDNGYAVDHICVKPKRNTVLVPLPQGLQVHPISVSKKRSSFLRYLIEYCLFFWSVFIKTNLLLRTNRYSFVQVFTMPEPLVFCALFAKIKKIPIIMDWEDPLYELFLTKFPKIISSFFKLPILIVEKCSVAFVDHIITPNNAFKNAFVKRGYSASKIDIVLNAPDLRVFKQALEVKSENVKPFSLLFNGSIFHRHGLDIGIEAVALARKRIPEIILTIIGEGESDYIEYCRQKIKQLDISSSVRWLGYVPIEQMPEKYSTATAVIIPNRKNPFTSINFPQRIFECGLLRKPVVVSRLPGIEAYMPGDAVQYVDPDNSVALSEGIIELLSNQDKYCQLVERAYQICTTISWEKEYHLAIGATIKPQDEEFAEIVVTNTDGI
jgi:glycosyltransferase involved in cell wall biosynthesis